MKKMRVDEWLIAHGFCADRDEALRMILEGRIRHNPDMPVRKASETVAFESALLVDTEESFASRGARKLQPVLERILPDLSGQSAVDVGASTGGFTDVLLRGGAKRVYAVDVGRGLLHAKLRNDPRVVCLEGVNARTLDRSLIPEEVDLAVMDVSFISATKILPAIDTVLKRGGHALILVKPQFEADRQDVPPGGVVTDPAVREACVEKVRRFAESRLGWIFLETTPSAIKGPKGNQEYIAVFRKG